MLDSKFPMFLAWGPELAFLYNDAYIDILGQKHPAALGNRFQDIWGELWPDLSPLIARALAGEATYGENVRLQMLRKEHEEQTWFTFSYSPLRDEQGKIAGMFCACTETTRQILAERRQAFQLALSDRLRGLGEPMAAIDVAAEALGRHLQVARVGYGEIDVQAGTVQVIRDWSAGVLRSLAGEIHSLAGFGPEAVAQLHVGQPLVVDDVRCDPRTVSHAAAYAGVDTRALLVVPLIRAGTLIATLYVHENQIRRWSEEDVALAQDVAERTWATVERARAEERRHRAEAALSAQLEAERNRLRTLFEQAPGFMAVLRGPQHVFELVNAAYMRLIGPREVLGRSIRVALPELEDQPFIGQLDLVYASGEPYFATEARVLLRRHPDGAMVERFVDFVYQPLTEANGHVSGIFVEGSDVTERMHAYMALRDADRRKDEFLAMLAHELRNPLAPISAAAQLLRIASHNEVRVRQTSEVITRQVEHMTGLVDELLDVSRVTRGLIRLEYKAVDMHDVISTAVEQVRALIETKRHMLRRRDHAGPVWVSGDRRRLVQIIGNLLNNAAKYTPDGGTIDIAVTVERAHALVRVSDTGVGIAPGLLPHIFEPFTQAERSPDRGQGGLGLGLALVRSLTQLHGGSVTARSDAGGSTFTLRLPLAAQAPAANAQNTESASAHPAQPSQSAHVMVVDDNRDAAQSLALLLESEGYRVDLAYDAAAALAQVQTDAPQVLLLDIGLPDMDGYQLARRLRALPQTVHATLIALTGYGQPQDQERSRSAGFDYHLVKPADTARLIALIGSLQHP